MLSRELQTKIINKRLTLKKAEKARACVKKLQSLRKSFKLYENDVDISDFISKRVLNYFIELGISPIPLSNGIPYMPSIGELLFHIPDKEKNKIQNFAAKHTRKEIWKYYD